MNLSWKIARRYLFARKSNNAINIITGVSMLGLTVGTAALILVLSVFNGFENLITGLFGHFNPDVKVTLAQGKTFSPDSTMLEQLRQLNGVEALSLTLEEVAFFEYKDHQDFGMLKGVDEAYNQVVSIDSTLREGVYLFQKDGIEMAVLGVGMRNKLAVNIDDYLASLSVYMPKRQTSGPLEQPFRKRVVYPAGTFVIQQDFDNQYILSSLDFARSLLSLTDEVSALEIRLRSNARKKPTIEAIRQIVGEEFLVQDRYQQDEAFLKLMNIEKWMSYAILTLTLLLVAFNMVGALWMIVLEKKKDIAILRAMGATDALIRNIFLRVGLLLCLLGLVLGFALSVGLYLLHTNLDDGLISIPQGFVVRAYPASMRWPDFVKVTLTVLGIGLLASWLPARRAQQVSGVMNE